MLCPRCSYEKTQVRGTVKGQTNERFRHCPRCGFTFQTIEAIRFDDYWKKYARSSVENDRHLHTQDEDAND